MKTKHTKTDPIIDKDKISHTALTIKIMRDQLLTASTSKSEVAPMIEDIKNYVEKISSDNKNTIINNNKKYVLYLLGGFIFVILLIFLITSI